MPEFKGIDVSSWQEVVAWDKVKKHGVQFAMIRAAYSTSPDRYFKRNIVRAAENGIDCGVYLYSCAATVEEARQEAEFVLELVKPYQLTYPIAFYMEDKVHYSLSKERRTQIAEAFCTAIEAAGYNSMIYASLYWLNEMLDIEKLKKFDKWVVQWGKQCTFKDVYGMWQNTDRGRIDGIDGYVGVNIAYKDYKTRLRTRNESRPLTGTFSPPGLSAGLRFIANQIPLFKSAMAREKFKDIHGVYWVYDGKVLRGRLKITNRAEKVEQIPESANVIGYVYKSDIRL